MSDFSRQLPPLSTLVVFEAACRLRNFSRAADECARSQASVSRQMKQLEDNLELKLFERHRYDVSPTDAGMHLYTTVRHTLGELAHTAGELREQAQGKSSFTIYSDISIGTSVLAPLIGRIQALYPLVRFNIISSYDPIEQTRSSFDIAFQAGRRAEDVFDVETIADDLVFPVCSPEFATQYKSRVTAKKLSTLPLLHLEYENKQCIGWQQFLAHYRVRELKSKTNWFSAPIRCPLMLRAAKASLGWGRSVTPELPMAN